MRTFKGDKYEAVSSDDSYRVYMRLKIRAVGPGDYGAYKCVAKNSLGETDGTIKLYGKRHCFFVLVLIWGGWKTFTYLIAVEIPNPHTTVSMTTVKQTTEPSIRHAKKKGKVSMPITISRESNSPPFPPNQKREKGPEQITITKISTRLPLKMKSPMIILKMVRQKIQLPRLTLVFFLNLRN